MPATDTRCRLAIDTSYVLAVAVLGAAFARGVVQNFHGTMFGDGDIATHAYQGYYLLHYLHLAPWPQLGLDNDALFYPYGNDQVFQPWVFERDLFAALCLRIHGGGPWVQVHYLASVLITALGLYFLLRREHSPPRAAFAGLAVAFCNYYPIAKFPGHANLCALHWSLLGVATDYVITRRVWRGETLSARWLLLRAALLFLTLGLEMGYVAGLSLSSFVLTAAWLAVLTWRRRQGEPWKGFANLARAGLTAARRDFRAHPWQTAALTFALAWGVFWYFPLAFEVFLHARKYPVDKILVGNWWQWANPLRVFLPIVPGLEPISSPGNFERLRGFFNDEPEGFFAMSPGLFFVLLGLLGLFLAWRRRQAGALVPILALWLLVLANHPDKFPVLRIFPWFAYVRTSAKLGNIHCLALVLMGIGGVPPGYFAMRRHRVFGAALGLLFVTEIVTAYRVRLLDERPYVDPSPAFYRCMEAIRRAPGAAVLEWPFCVASGNGLGTREFGPFYQRQAALYALSMFHGKKVVSGYYGRLFPQQLAPFYHAGWQQLFFPDNTDQREVERQARDFDAPRWTFLETFFHENDFCGLLLSADLLPPQTLREMHARFGSPVATADDGADGRIEFIPRPVSWARPNDPAEGKDATFAVPLDLPVTHIDFTRDAASDYLREGWDRPDHQPLYSIAHTARVVFQSVAFPADARWTMDLFATTYEAQSFTVRFNGQVIKTWRSTGGPHRHFVADLPAGAWRQGTNQITFDLPQAHHLHWKWNRPNDDRPFGLKVDTLDLTEILSR